MPPPRLSAPALADHLSLFEPGARRIVRTLRAAVLHAAPWAAEAIRFRVLSYYVQDAFLGSIGGNICMIEAKGGRVFLSFIHGAALPDPRSLLFGAGKSKRFARIPDVDAARSDDVRRLLRAAALLAQRRARHSPRRPR